MQMETMRLVKFLSRCGTVSRRGAGDLVLAGRVAVNGTVTLNPGLQVSEMDTVTVDGKPAAQEDRKYYIMLNRPRGYTCSADDRYAEHLALELIDLPVRLFSAGRLDRESEGLILFSNDGDFIERLTHPRHAVRKRYVVTVSKPFTDADIRRLTSGIVDDGDRLAALAVRKLDEKRYMFTLGEGKKREIRRMVAALGAKTLRLKRIAVGNLTLGPLPAGKWRELTPEERDQALMKPASISE